MKTKEKTSRVMFLGLIIAVILIAVAGMNMRTIINSTGVTRTARQAGASDTTQGDVLENYTFTSDTAGVGVAGSITDYSKVLKQIKLTAASANRVVTLDLDDGYYTQINVDTTDVYDAGYDAGYEKGTKDVITEFSTNYGRIDVIWLSGTSNTVTATPNAPILTSNGESMTPIKWNASNAIVTTTSSDSSWYSYVAGSGNDDNSQSGNTSSRWANAKTANDSYFVWIPRFAYRITYYDSETSTEPMGYYDGKGMWNANNGKIRYEIEAGIETITYNGKEYIVHPAFNTDLDLGGWNTKLTGFWFAKFEMSGATPQTLKSTFGVQSQRRQKIGEQYINARQATYGYNGSQDSFDNYTSFMNSHMVKNSEWGAVACLTHSQYGRNGTEITINDNSGFYTGGGSNLADYVVNAAQSTTGNTYGIYDMNGGAWEYVASFDRKAYDDYLKGANYGKELTDEIPIGENGTYISTKYATTYIYGRDSYTGNAIYKVGKTGDLSKEIYGGEIKAASFFEDFANIVGLSYPFFVRGGLHLNGVNAGVFAATYATGQMSGNYGFRTGLCP